MLQNEFTAKSGFNLNWKGFAGLGGLAACLGLAVLVLLYSASHHGARSQRCWGMKEKTPFKGLSSKFNCRIQDILWCYEQSLFGGA